MPPLQRRRRGFIVEFYPSIETTDRRGNKTVGPDPNAVPIEVRAWVVPDRSSKAEVPGQQQINVYTLGTHADLPGVDMFSRVHWNSAWWDIVSPPAHHEGDRHTRHWTLTIRERPDEGGLNG